MALNESKGNMYPGVKTWNPLGGKCPHNCGYCSTKSLMRYPVIRNKYSGPLALYENVLKQCPGSDNTVFVVGQNDLFTKAVPDEWILKVLKRCWMWENTYLFQSKNPERFLDFLGHFPPKTILCTTIESDHIWPQMGNTPHPRKRALAMGQIIGFVKQVTIEPIMEFSLQGLVDLIKIANPASVNLGADSKYNHLPEPSKEKILALIDELKKFTVIDQKRNLNRLLK